MHMYGSVLDDAQAPPIPPSGETEAIEDEPL